MSKLPYNIAYGQHHRRRDHPRAHLRRNFPPVPRHEHWGSYGCRSGWYYTGGRRLLAVEPQ